MFYCRIHDPIEKAKKQKVRDQKKWDAEVVLAVSLLHLLN
jgi:hypothetical protein